VLDDRRTDLQEAPAEEHDGVEDEDDDRAEAQDDHEGSRSALTR